jgi:hypothetical protein
MNGQTIKIARFGASTLPDAQRFRRGYHLIILSDMNRQIIAGYKLCLSVNSYHHTCSVYNRLAPKKMNRARQQTSLEYDIICIEKNRATHEALRIAFGFSKRAILMYDNPPSSVYIAEIYPQLWVPLPTIVG